MPVLQKLTHLACIAGILLLPLISLAEDREQQVPRVQKGVIDLRSVDFENQLIELTGEWALYPYELLTPGANFDTYYRTWHHLPALWKGISSPKGILNAHGYATYRLKVLLPANVPYDKLAIDIPDAYTSLKVFVDDELIAEFGKPDTSAATTQPGYRTQARRLLLTADTIWLTLQVANFHHRRGGPYKPLVIGYNDVIKIKKEHKRALDLFLTGCLIMGGLFFLGLYFWSRKDKVILYFSMICIIYSYRIIGTVDYTILYIFPKLDWFIALHIEYLTLFLIVYFITLFSRALYPQEYSRKVAHFFMGFSLSCAIGTLLTPTTIFTHLVNPFLVAMLFNIVYTIYIYYLGYRHKRPGALLSLISTGVLGLIFLAIILAYFAIAHLSPFLLSIGYIIFFFMQSLVLSYRFAYQLKAARTEALRSSQAKSDFLNTMSHEIRTPLNSVIGISSLMQQQEPDADSKELLDTLQISARNLLFVINDILDFSKIESGKASIQLQPALLQQIADNILKSVFVLVKEKSLELNWRIDERLNAQYVMIDPERTTQVLLNLMQNAVKFTHAGYVRLKMEVVDESSSKLKVRFSVADTGIGIPEEKKKIIFDHFTQVDSSINRGYGGTGLGLAICKQILAQQGVKLYLHSVMNEGSLFWFEQSFTKASKPVEEVHSSRHTQAAIRAKLGTYRILLADDNPINIKITEKLLLNAIPGLRIYHAAHGKAAVEMVEAHAPDLVLMDVNMPVMNGLDASRAIRQLKDRKLAGTPIIALTAGNIREEKETCIAAGMNGIVAKPFTIDEILESIITVVYNKV